MSRIYSAPRPRVWLIAATCALLAGCTTVGPNWHGAPASAPDSSARGAFLRAPAMTTAQTPPARWWEALNDPLLDQVITRAIAGSPDLTAAQARIDQAQATLATTRSASAFKASVGVIAAEASLPGGLLGRDGRLSEQVYADNFQASWELDLFGANRRRTEGARDRADAASASAADVAVTLSAQIARAYVQMRAQQATVQVLTQQVEIDRALVAHAQDRFDHGTTPSQTIDTARGALVQSQSDLTDAQAQVVTLIDQIAVLSGQEPGALDGMLAPPMPVPMAPAQVAVGDPAGLLRHRPDIRKAEAQLAAATADVGARMADRLPSISFTGILGAGGTNVGDAVSPGSIIGLLIPQIKWSFLDGGRGAAQVRLARGARAEAEATYRSTVLTALQDAENSLTRFGNLRVDYGKSLEAQAATEHLAAMQATRAAGGTLSQADAQSAARQVLRASLASTSAQAQMTVGFISVEKALGLGWDSASAAK